MGEQGFKRPPTAQAAVLEEMRRAIMVREIPPGAPIRQDELAKRLGVSRVPVREALKVLEAEGLIKHIPHFGFFVPTLNIRDLIEIYTVREALEELALRTGMEQLEPLDFDRLEATLAAIDEAQTSGDLAALTVANRAFHFAILEPCRMPRLLRIVRTLWDSMEPYRPVYFMETEPRARLQHEHREIVTAMRAGDTDTVVKLLNAHRHNLMEALRRAFERDEPT